MKKILAVILCICMMFTLAVGVFAQEGTDDTEVDIDSVFPTTVNFEKAEVIKGGDVTVDIMVENNPSITEIKVTFNLPAGITIKSVANGDFGTATLENNVVTVSAKDTMTDDGCIAKVTFTATTEGEKKVTLSATAKNGANDVSVSSFEGVVNVIVPAAVVIPGDVDGDGKADAIDLAKMKRYLADLEDEVCPGADLNDDESVDAIDLAKLKLLLVGK